jgi:hypothetical protein
MNDNLFKLLKVRIHVFDSFENPENSINPARPENSFS